MEIKRVSSFGKHLILILWPTLVIIKSIKLNLSNSPTHIMTPSTVGLASPTKTHTKSSRSQVQNTPTTNFYINLTKTILNVKRIKTLH